MPITCPIRQVSQAYDQSSLWTFRLPNRNDESLAYHKQCILRAALVLSSNHFKLTMKGEIWGPRKKPRNGWGP